MDYAATHSDPDPISTYRESDMVLAVHGDVSYLSEPEARGQAGGHIFMASNCPIPHDNGDVLDITQLNYCRD